uniref:Plectrovirus spv1-r8a2b orf 11 transmembrane protein n=1 Tax=Spiroplasma citri TaxID=2133 RepID=Q14PZ8_SPICI|nr:plectrovirus spv1-r8a2b orf 11 transmembrane protein [Spiroplasma citri]
MIIEFNLLVILLVQMPLSFYMLYPLCYLLFYFLECFLNLFKKCGVFKNAKWLN